MSGTHNARQCLERLEFRGLVPSKLRHLHNQEAVFFFFFAVRHSFLASWQTGKMQTAARAKAKDGKGPTSGGRWWGGGGVGGGERGEQQSRILQSRREAGNKK